MIVSLREGKFVSLPSQKGTNKKGKTREKRTAKAGKETGRVETNADKKPDEKD